MAANAFSQVAIQKKDFSTQEMLIAGGLSYTPYKAMSIVKKYFGGGSVDSLTYGLYANSAQYLLYNELSNKYKNFTDNGLSCSAP